MLVENQAVGHTALAQYSTCTHRIISNYLLDSKVGYSLLEFTYHGLGLTEMVLLQLPQKYTKCAADSNDFFPDTPTANDRRYIWHK